LRRPWAGFTGGARAACTARTFAEYHRLDWWFLRQRQLAGMESGSDRQISDAEISAAVSAFISDAPAGRIVEALYRRDDPALEQTLAKLSALLPIEQIAIVQLIERLNLSGLPAVVLLTAVLGKIRTEEEWIHYNLAQQLWLMLGAGVAEAKLPAIIHALLARQGLKDNPDAQPMLLSVLGQELMPFAPREAIRYSMLAARHGNETALQNAAPAFAALDMEAIAKRPSVTELLELATELHLGADNLPNFAQSTDLAAASGVSSVVVERQRRVVFPAVSGDRSHYIFRAAEKPVDMPPITIHRFENGIFSIDARMRGLERHYVFDQGGNCVLDLANGSEPFIAEPVLEFDEPVAILDDRFSGVLNICHLLLDRITRIPLYERAWARPGKFFLVDDFRYHREIFDRLGLGDRLIIPTEKRVSIRAPELLFSSNIAADFRHPAHFCADWALEYLRGALAIGDRQARPERKLMISRGDTRGRRIVNWEEVLPVFARHRFEIVELAGLSTEAQIALFRDASQIVGVHGAGLTNMLFAPRDCAVLEILPPLVAVHDYWLLASALGQHYEALIAEDIEYPRPDYTTWQHNDGYNERDLVVPMERLEAALTALEEMTKAAAKPQPGAVQENLAGFEICGPIRRTPDHLHQAFTMDGAIPVQEEFFDNSGGDNQIRWTAEQYGELRRSAQECIDREQEQKWFRYPSDPFLVRLLKRHAIVGQSVLVIGSEIPFYEAMIAQFGGMPATLEYRPIRHDIEGLQTFTVEQLQDTERQFDCVVSISLSEHSGLGRYGDLLDSDGDFKTMELCRRHLKLGGLIFLHVPVGPDALVWNAHRIYGQARLPRLFRGWRQLDAEGFDEGMLTRGEPGAQYYPVFLLRKELTPCDAVERQKTGEADRTMTVAVHDTPADLPLINVALHKPSTQSSDSGHRCPSKPFDGSATSGVKTGGFGFCTMEETDPWWMLDLQRVYQVQRIIVYNRETAAPERANTMSVCLGLNPTGPWREVYRCSGKFGGVLSDSPLVIKLNEAIPARYVRLHLNDTQFFHLDEVEVYAQPSPDEPYFNRLLEGYRLQTPIPEERRGADADIVNSDAWNWAVFCGRHGLDPPGMRRDWSGRKVRFEFDHAVPFDGKVTALRAEPVGGIGNVFYDLLNACLIARVLGCAALELPDLETGLEQLPFAVDGLRIERAGPARTDGAVLAGPFYWPNGFEPLLQNYGTEFLLDTIDRFIRPIFTNLLNAAGPSSSRVLAMHFRAGDIFFPGGTHPWYVQPPASFYLKALRFAMENLGVRTVLMVFQDRSNPTVDIVSEFLIQQKIPFISQSSTMFADMVALMSADHLVAPYGTFCEMAGLLSKRIRTYFGFRTISTQTEIKFWAQSRAEGVLQAKGLRTFLIDDVDGSYIAPNTWTNTPEQIVLMREFPEAKLRLVELSRQQTSALPIMHTSKPHAIANSILPGDLVFDIGANRGDKAEWFLGLGAHVVCVEPQPAMVQSLKERFPSNPRVSVVAKGLADRPGRLAMSINTAAPVLSTFAEQWKTGRFADQTWDEVVEVEVTTFDQLIAAFGVPRYAKVDVQGFEKEVVRGLSARVGCISFKFTAEFFSDAVVVIEYLCKIGYSTFNYSISEQENFRLEEWLARTQFINTLERVCALEPVCWGDIYAL
jgi:FkbM family methyltransferase